MLSRDAEPRRKPEARELIASIVFGSLLILMAVVAAFGPAAPAAAAAVPDTFVLALASDPVTLNPIYAGDRSSLVAVNFVFDGLFTRKPEGGYTGALVSTYDVSKDGLTYTLHLRRGVKWHDGKPFASADVVFTLECVLDPKQGSPFRESFVIDGTPMKVSAPDDDTVVIKLPKPFAPLIFNLSDFNIRMLPKHLLADESDLQKVAFNQHPVGTGPFKFVKWTSGDRVVLTRNDSYWRGKPGVKNVVLRIVPDSNSQRIAMKAGDIDAMGLPAADYAQVAADPDVDVVKYEEGRVQSLILNMRRAPLNDLAVRRAIAYAVDKKALVQAVLMGMGTPAYSPFAPTDVGYTSAVAKYEYDPKKAEDVLDDAGWKKGADGIRGKGGNRLSFELIYQEGRQADQKLALIMQAELKQVGIEMKLRSLEGSAFVKEMLDPSDPKPYDALLNGWIMGPESDSYYSIFGSTQYPKGYNMAGYSSGKVDDLFDQARIESDSAKRASIYGGIQKEIMNDVPLVPLFYNKGLFAVSKRIGGVEKAGVIPVFYVGQPWYLTVK